MKNTLIGKLREEIGELLQYYGFTGKFSIRYRKGILRLALEKWDGKVHPLVLGSRVGDIAGKFGVEMEISSKNMFS